MDGALTHPVMCLTSAHRRRDLAALISGPQGRPQPVALRLLESLA